MQFITLISAFADIFTWVAPLKVIGFDMKLLYAGGDASDPPQNAVYRLFALCMIAIGLLETTVE